MTTWIYSHNPGSEGATLLAQAMGIRKIRHEGSRFVGRANKRVINWGSSTLPDHVAACNIVNRPDSIRTAANKLEFFRRMGQDDVPEWTTDMNRAIEMVSDGDTMVARTVLSGHSGEGIVIMERDNPASFVRAPLYVKYIKKSEEYRVHVAFGQVIDVQRKTITAEEINRRGRENVNWKVRNLANGFTYLRGNVNLAQAGRDIAIRAVGRCGLDFGAVDIIWNERSNTYYILEINTAPGITGTTVQNYANALRER